MFSRVGYDLYLSKGDTGILSINIGGAYLLTDNDRVLFTIKDGNQPVIIRAVTAVANTAMIEFTNAMTENLPVKEYKYDIRVILDAVLDNDGLPVDGTVVNTHFKPAKFKLLETVGDV